MRRTEQAQGLSLMKFEEVYARTTARLLSQAEAAEVVGVSSRTFRRWRDRYETEGARGPRPLVGPDRDHGRRHQHDLLGLLRRRAGHDVELPGVV